MIQLSISKLKLFKACRRAYELKYLEGLEPVETADALKVGLGYHSRLESIYKGEAVEADYSKEAAMTEAYRKYILPQIPKVTPEIWVEKEFDWGVLRGRVDGASPDGALVEHKTTSLSPEEYLFNLQLDEQILAYMYLTGYRQVHYTVCRKPTIRQKKSETDEEFFRRMVEWYDEDPNQKIGTFLIQRTNREVFIFAVELNKVAEEMNASDCVYYRNTCNCNIWGRRCEYAPVCLHYDPAQEYVGLKKKEEKCNGESDFIF